MKITTTQAAERYDIPLKTQDAMRAAGTLPYEKVGRRVIYDTDTLDPIARSRALGARAYVAITNINTGEHT